MINSPSVFSNKWGAQAQDSEHTLRGTGTPPGQSVELSIGPLHQNRCGLLGSVDRGESCALRVPFYGLSGRFLQRFLCQLGIRREALDARR